MSAPASKAQSNLSNTLWAILGNGMDFLLRFLSAPFLTRTLSYEDYAAYGQVLLVTDVAASVLGLGVSAMLYNYYADKKHDPSQVFSASMWLMGTIAVVGIGLILLFAGPISGWVNSPGIENYIRVYSLTLLFTLPLNCVQATLYFHKVVRATVRNQLLFTVLRIGVLFVGIYWLQSLFYMFLLFVVLAIVQFALQYSYLPTGLGKAIFKPSKKLVFELLETSWALGVMVAMRYTSQQVGAIVVTVMLSTYDYAQYRAGAFWVPLLSTVYRSVSNILSPGVLKAYYDHDYGAVIQLRAKIVQNIAGLVFPSLLFVLVFAPPLIEAYLGNRYADSAWVFILFNIAVLYKLNNTEEIIMAAHQNNFLAVLNAAQFILSILLTMLGIALFGLYGGASAMFIAYTLYWVAVQAKTARILKCPFAAVFPFWGICRVLLACLACLAPFAVAFYSLSLPNWAPLVGLPFYLAGVYFLLLRQRLIEREYPARILGRFKIPKRVLNWYLGPTRSA